MPKIPQVFAERAEMGRPAGAADVDQGGLAELGQAVKGIGDISLRLFDTEMDSRVAAQEGKAVSAIHDLQLEVEQIPDHNSRDAIYAKKSQEIIKEFGEPLRFEKYKGLYLEQIGGTLERGRVSIARNVRQSQLDAIQSNISIFVESKIGEHGNELSEIVRGDIEGQVIGIYNDAAISGSMSSARAERLKLDAIKRMRDNDFVIEAQATTDMIRMGSDEDGPWSYARQLEEIYALPGLLRDEVRKRFDIQHDARERNASISESELFRSEYWRVLSGPGTGYTDIETLRDELKAKGFEPDKAEYLLKVAEAREAGVTLPATVSTVNDLREDIVKRKIRYTRDLLPHLGEIGDKFTNLDTLIKKTQDKDARELESASSEFLKMARVKLVKSTLNFVDAVGEEAFFEFQDWFIRQRDERLKDIQDPTERLTVVREMVNPSNPQTEDGSDYAGRHIERFRKTPEQQLSDLARMWAPLSTKAAGAPVVAQDEVGTPVLSVPTLDGNEVQVPIRQRRLGESIEEFLASQAIDALASPVPEDSQVEAE